MKKKLIFTIISIMLLVAALTPIVSKADSGWDSDYDSGGWDSGSSWDSGGWDSGSDWGSSDSNWHYSGGSSFSGSGSGFIGLIFGFIFLVVIIAIVSNINKPKGPKSGNGSNTNISSSIDIDYQDIEQSKIDEIDSSVKIEEFKHQAFNIYKDIQEAWMNFDTDTIRKLTTDEIYNMYSSQLETLKLKHQKNIMKNIEYVDAKITNIKLSDDVISVVVFLRVKCLDYVINEKTNKTVRGSDSTRLDIQYLLTFVKSKSNNNETEKCPNCGAPVDIVSSATCPYCNSTLVKDASNYVLSKKTCVGQRYDK